MANYQIALNKLLATVATSLTEEQKSKLIKLKEKIEQQVGKSILTKLS